MIADALDRLVVLTVEQTGTPEGPAWWEVATGIIAVPTGLIGLWYTVALIRKTRLEADKAEFELQRMRGEIEARLSKESSPAVDVFAEPLLRSQHVQDLIVRFVILSVVLLIWGLAGQVFNLVSENGVRAYFVQFADDPERPTLGEATFGVIASLFSAVPNIGRSIVVVGLGWPLLLESFKLGNTSAPNLVKRRATYRVLLTLAVIVPVASSLSEVIWVWIS